MAGNYIPRFPRASAPRNFLTRVLHPLRVSEKRAYRAYLLRLWQVAGPHWRASLDDPHTGQRLVFASVRQLLQHLEHLTDDAPAPPRSGPTQSSGGSHAAQDTPFDSV